MEHNVKGIATFLSNARPSISTNIPTTRNLKRCHWRATQSRVSKVKNTLEPAGQPPWATTKKCKHSRIPQQRHSGSVWMTRALFARSPDVASRAQRLFAPTAVYFSGEFAISVGRVSHASPKPFKNPALAVSHVERELSQTHISGLDKASFESTCKRKK